MSPPVQPAPRPANDSIDDAPGPAHGVESVWIEPMRCRPRPVFATRPVPPWLRQPIPSKPYPRAVWIAGHWTWQDHWVWAYGVWAPRPGAAWRWRAARYLGSGRGVWFTPAHWRLGAADDGDETDEGDEALAVTHDAAGALDGGRLRAAPGSDWAPLPRSELARRIAPGRAA